MLRQQREEELAEVDLTHLTTPKRIQFLERKIKGRLLDSQLLMKENENMKQKIA